MGSRGRETQRRILAAAREVLDDVGYHAANVESIAARAGCSRPTFYQYFASKEELLRRLAGRLGEDLAELTEQLDRVDATAPGRDVLAGWLDRYVALYQRDEPVFRAFAVAIRNDEMMAKGATALTGRYGAALAGALHRPQPGSMPLEVTASLVMTTVARAAALRGGAAGRVGRERFVQALADLTHRCFFGVVDGVNTGAGAGRAGSARARRSRALPVDAAPLVDAPGPEPPNRRPSGQRTRQRLLDAAAEVFPRLGFHDTRVDDIVAEAGLSHGTFYRYFASVGDVFRVLSTGSVRSMLELLDEIPGPEAAVRSAATVESWTQRWYDQYARNGALFGVWAEADGSGDALADQVVRAVVARLRLVLAARSFGDGQVDAMALLALLERGPYMARTYGDLAPAEAIAASAGLIQRGFLGGRTA